MRARASANYSGKFYESARTASTGADTRLLLFGGDSADTARGSQYPTPCVEVMHQHHWRIQQPRRGDTENLRLKFPEQRAALRDRIPILVGGATHRKASGIRFAASRTMATTLSNGLRRFRPQMAESG